MRTRPPIREVGLALLALAPMAVPPALAQSPKDVTIVNTEANPVPVQERREPFEARVQFTIPILGGHGSDSVSIPDGKRFVIEYVSVLVFGIAREARVNTGAVPHFFPTHPGLTGFSVGGQTIRVYAQTSVELEVVMAEPNPGQVPVIGSFSGYLVDAP